MEYKIIEKQQIEDSIDVLVEFKVDMTEFEMEELVETCKVFVSQPKDEFQVIEEIEMRVDYEISKFQSIERNKRIIERL
jgi:hypothetical protein